MALDPELTDSDGLPAAKVFYRYSESSLKLAGFHIARAREAMQASGATEIVVVRSSVTASAI